MQGPKRSTQAMSEDTKQTTLSYFEKPSKKKKTLRQANKLIMCDDTMHKHHHTYPETYKNMIICGDTGKQHDHI
jgi:hypothetical protein